MYKVLLSFRVISDVYRPFIPNKISFAKYSLTQWISKLPWSFKINWLRQYLVNLIGLSGIVNATLYKNEPIFTGLGHD